MPSEGSIRDFFISYNQADAHWAEWIAWQLEAAGYTTWFQAWDFGLGSNFAAEMHKALSGTRHTIILLSPSFLESGYAQAEWTATFVHDPLAKDRKLLPIRVRECDPPGLLSPLVNLDLASKDDESAARTDLLKAIETALRLAEGQRPKPAIPPQWPGKAPAKQPPPQFPPRMSSGEEPGSAPAGPPKLTPPDLDHILPSRSPIVMAIERRDQPILRVDLLPVGRHLTVKLTSDEVHALGQRQPELIERLIEDSVGRPAFRAQEARALFQLMIPDDLKDGLAQVARVVFVLDAETATYPWELMVDGDEPLCTRMSMVRQLQTAHFRAQIRASTAQTAYVVGDPIVPPPYLQLPGAREEARVVNDLLKTRFETTYSAEQLTALEVLGGLYGRPYRIVHLAGHGQYEAPTAGVPRGRRAARARFRAPVVRGQPGDGKALSGMVLDNGVLLTAVEIRKMQQTPELVFLNCCFIGQMGPGRGSKFPEFNRLAASISRELIEAGVCAVVAAGWAVRDDAAVHFARCFYQYMLEGHSFGSALRYARYQTWRQPQFADCATWGAYQAYGDPDFRLDPASAGSGG